MTDEKDITRVTHTEIDLQYGLPIRNSEYFKNPKTLSHRSLWEILLVLLFVTIFSHDRLSFYQH